MYLRIRIKTETILQDVVHVIASHILISHPFFVFLVDGKYSPWSQWSACSKSCGYGIQTRKRTCTDPEPQHGGRDCTDLGDPEHIRPCQVIQCPSKFLMGGGKTKDVNKSIYSFLKLTPATRSILNHFSCSKLQNVQHSSLIISQTGFLKKGCCGKL